MINIVNDISDDEEKLNDIYSLMINRVCELDKQEEDTSTPFEKVIYRIEKILGIDRNIDQEEIFLSDPQEIISNGELQEAFVEEDGTNLTFHIPLPAPPMFTKLCV
jgi:hypothetical protein